MILNVHSDASYLSEPRARSRLGGLFFMGTIPVNGQPIQLNAAEAKLGALFYNFQDSTILQLTLNELGHPQQPTPVTCNNSTAVSIANNTVKKQ